MNKESRIKFKEVIFRFLKHMKGSFTYQDIQEMSLPEFFEWQKIAIDTQKEENRKNEQELKKQQSNRRF